MLDAPLFVILAGGEGKRFAPHLVIKKALPANTIYKSYNTTHD